MINNIRPTSNLPYGYGISKVDQVTKTSLDMQKEREKQNQEKRKRLLAQKSFMQVLQQKMIEEKIEAQETDEVKHFDMRI